VLTGYYWVLTGYSGVHTGYYGGTHGLLWGTHGVLWGHASIPHRGARRRSTRHTVGRMRTASVARLESCCEGMQGVLWVLRRPLGVLIGYSRRAPRRAWTIDRSKPRAAFTCGQPEHMRRVFGGSECGCSHPHHPSANRHPHHPSAHYGRADVCAGRCSPVAAAVGQRTQAALDRLRPTRPRRFRAASPMASAADRPRRTTRAGSALWAAVNVTYTAVDGGLVAWLNNQTASYNSSTVHVTLPSGNVARGAASLQLPSGLNLILQGRGMAGASNTTLDLERNNLDVGGMLGDGGRIEFRNMRVRNVRLSRARAAVRVLLMTPWLVCAGLCGAPVPAPTPADARAGCAVLSPHWWCAACFMHRDHAVRPVTAAHCIRWSVVGCVACCTSCVVRRIDCCIGGCNQAHPAQQGTRAPSWV
jgi:hypothetical protein